MTNGILIVDDHAMMRDGLRALFRDDPGLAIVGEASDGSEAVQKSLDLNPDIVLMDISMPTLDGIEASQRIRDVNPTAKILILSKHETSGYVLAAIEAGAAGYLPKKANRQELLSAVRAVAKGDSFLHPSVAPLVLRALNEHKTLRGRHLSETDREILHLLTESHTSREIAKLLGLSERTIAGRRARIMSRLEEHSVTGLVKFAVRTGVVDLAK